jgi:hypothetical protein
MTLNLKNIKNTISESIKKVKNIRREDLTKENIINYLKKIYNDYIKPFDVMKLSYIPFIGWLIPMYLNRDEFQKYHAKQGLVLAVYFTLACIFLYCFMVFVPERADIVQLFIVLLIYIHHIVYFTLCYLGTKMINRGEKGEFPYIQQYIRKFTIKIEI